MAKVLEARKFAIEHLKLCVRLYKMQIRAGRYFLHEPPSSAVSWQVECIKELMGSSVVM